MKSRRTVYHCGGGAIVSVDEIEVEDVLLIGGPHNGRIIMMVNVLDDEVIMPGDVTCIYKRVWPDRFEFDRYREVLTA